MVYNIHVHLYIIMLFFILQTFLTYAEFYILHHRGYGLKKITYAYFKKGLSDVYSIFKGFITACIIWVE